MDTSDTDELAKAIFRAELEPRFITVPETPDKQHLDYTGHVRIDGEPQGLQFGIQLKGTASPRVSKSAIAVSVRKKHLRYWIEQSRIPVFLVVVDTTRREAFFRSVHEWDLASSSRWKKRTKPAVTVPLANRLSDSDGFLAAIRSAWARLEELHPGSFAAAAHSEVERLTRIDPRFRFKLTHGDGVSQVTLLARETVEAQLQVHGAPAVEKWNRMYRTGAPEEFGPGELRLNGGGIFDEMERQAGGRPVTWTVTSETACDVSLFLRHADGSEAFALGGLHAALVGGTEERRFEAKHPYAPISVRGELRFIDENPGVRIDGTFTLSLKTLHWNSLRVLDLPAFPFVEDFFTTVRQAESVVVQIIVAGALPFRGLLSAQDVLHSLGSPVDFLSRVRSAAQKLRVNPVLSASGLEEAAAASLCDLIEAGELVQPTKSGQRVGTVTLDPATASPGAGALILAGDSLSVTELSALTLLGEESPAFLIERTVFSLRPTAATRTAVEALPPGAQLAVYELETGEGATVRHKLIPRD